MGPPGLNVPGAPPGQQQVFPVTLSNLHRGTGFEEGLEVDFEFTDGERKAGDVILVRTQSGRITAVSLVGTKSKTKGTVKLGKFNGKVDVVMMRGRVGQNPGTPISNTLTLDK
jgi:hypothetical protein